MLRQVLPELLHAHDNADGAARSRSGYVFPPHLVLERGITLRAWCTCSTGGGGSAGNGGGRARNFFEVSTMVDSVGSMLAQLHASGRVHRDIKPGAQA